jgi:NADPH:quinone reductase-like Zn-dependent oxidoreductase
MSTTSGTMKALRAHERGGPERLVYEDAPVPAAPQDDDVLVRVRAASLTFDELTWDETWQADGVDRTPIVPSHEFAGVVVAVGPDAAGVTEGDEVFGLAPFDRDGAAAEYVLVPASSIARKPRGVADAVAAAAVLPALTAMEALDEHLGLGAGQRLLVRGGTGGVGAFVTQFAHARGIRVGVTVRSPEAEERARRLGAAEVFVGDEPEVPTGAFDAAIDAAGAGTPGWLYRAVRRGGRVVTLQEAPDAALAEELGLEARFFVVTTSTAQLERLARTLSEGDVEVAISRTFPLAEGRAAYESRGRGGAPGKTVLLVASA